MLNNYLFRHRIIGNTQMFAAQTKGEAVGMLDARTRGDHRSYFLEMVEFDLGDPDNLIPVIVNEKVN